MTSSQPFWSRPRPIARRPPPAAVEVLVVGGGMSGVSLLRELSIRGVKAALVEARHLAWGASGRNAGFLLAGTTDNYAAAVDAYGRSVAREAWDFTTENHSRLAEALAGRAPYRRGGSIVLAASTEEAEELERSAELLTEDGVRVEYGEGALLKPEDGEIDPAAAVGALAADCPEGSIFEGIEVASLDQLPVEAEQVVLCTNAYTPRLLPGAPIAPTRAQMLATAPERHRVADRPTYSDFGYRYWRQLPSGEVLCGGWRNTSFDTETTDAIATTEKVQSGIERGVRALGASAPVTHRWAGIMGFTPDALPIVGAVQSRPGTWICAGYTGHGMAFAFNCARVLATHITGGPPPPKWMVASRFSL